MFYYSFILLIYLFFYLFTNLCICFNDNRTQGASFFIFCLLSLYVCPHYFHKSSPIIFNFIFSSFHWGRIQDIEFERLGLLLIIHCMGNTFKVSTSYYVFLCFIILFCKGQPFISVCF